MYKRQIPGNEIIIIVKMETLTLPVTKKMKETENGEDNGLSVTARDRIKMCIRDSQKGSCTGKGVV